MNNRISNNLFGEFDSLSITFSLYLRVKRNKCAKIIGLITATLFGHRA